MRPAFRGGDGNFFGSSQRDVMRQLYRHHRGNEEQVVRAYAAAEERWEIPRSSNRHGLDAEAYARALWADGRRKGWLQGR